MVSVVKRQFIEKKGIGVVCVLVLMLSACSVKPSQHPAPEKSKAPAPEQTQRSTQAQIQAITRERMRDIRQAQPSKAVSRAKPIHPAITKLLKQALGQQQQGALEKSAATLERALRIQPNEPLAWNRLAFVRLQQNQWRQAEQLALKSNSLTAQDSLMMRNWRIIADARKHQGNAIGAKAARRQAKQLKR